MKMNMVSMALIGICLSTVTAARGAPFDSGSTGSHGAFNPTASTNLILPPDGIFHFTTVNIPNGVGVGFIRNALNTPVYILAQSNVVINGTLDLPGGHSSLSNPGRGGPGGFDGGFGAVQTYPPSDGQGPGGGKITNSYSGVFGLPKGQNSNVYGNTLLVPLIGGSGGAGGTDGNGGGGGGGAIVIASNTRITITYRGGGGNPYNIYAYGGNCGGAAGIGGAGSGGGVRLVAPVVDGTGSIAVYGGGASNVNFQGGAGRIRIDTLDRHAWQTLNVDDFGAKWTVGSQMYVFPPGNPRLDIVEAAGQTIPEGTNGPVSVLLPPGTSTNQIVKVKATGFTNDVPVTVAITPEAGRSKRFNALIAVSGQNPVISSINVEIPDDSFCHVHVWTR